MGLPGFSHANIAARGATQAPLTFGAKETMNKSVVTLLIVCGVFAGTARQASAQGATWADRGYINVGWGVESGSSAMTDIADLDDLRRNRDRHLVQHVHVGQPV